MNMVAVAPAEVMARVEARSRLDPTFVGVLAFLVDIPSSAAGEFAPLAVRELNRQRRADALENFRDGALATFEVQQLLSLGTPQAVHRLRSRGRLIGQQIGNATWFPAWQFSDGRIRSDLPEIIQTLHRFTADSIAADRVMRLKRDELGGRSIAEALDRKRIAATARAILADLGS